MVCAFLGCEVSGDLMQTGKAGDADYYVVV